MFRHPRSPVAGDAIAFSPPWPRLLKQESAVAYIMSEWSTYPARLRRGCPALRPWQLTSAAAALLVLFYNQGFWQTFVTATGGAAPANAMLYLGTFAMLALVFNAFLSVAAFRYVLKPVLSALFFVAAATS
jgi:hypothetical protein